MNEYDVVVIGYGPWADGEPSAGPGGPPGHRAGAPPQLYGLSRAGHIDDEIMRTLQRVGAGEEFRDDAVAWELYDMRNKAFGGDLLLSLDWSQIGPHGYRGALDLLPEQPRAGAEPPDRRLGNVEVAHGPRGRSTSTRTPTVSLSPPQPQERASERTVRAAYAVAADGDNSFVRDQLGITTTPAPAGRCSWSSTRCRSASCPSSSTTASSPTRARPAACSSSARPHRRWEFTLLPDEKPEDFTLDTRLGAARPLGELRGRRGAALPGLPVPRVDDR